MYERPWHYFTVRGRRNDPKANTLIFNPPLFIATAYGLFWMRRFSVHGMQSRWDNPEPWATITHLEADLHRIEPVGVKVMMHLCFYREE